MKELRNIKKYGYWGFLFLGIFLLYFTFRNTNFQEIKNELLSVKPVYLLWLLIPSWGGQFLRAWRWRILLGKDNTYPIVYHSLLFGYFVNLALPRVGEITRCVTIQSLNKTPFTKSLGTVVMERVADLFMLLLVVMAAFYLNGQKWQDWGKQKIVEPLLVLAQNHPYLIGGIVLLGFLAFFLLVFFTNKRMEKAPKAFNHLMEGIVGLFKLSVWQIVLFAFLSMAIWLCYFLTTYLWFLALPSAQGAGVSVAFSVMVVGSLVKTLPIQGGGAGAYHLVIGELLVLYGLGAVSSNTFALLNHGYQTVFYLIFGGISALWIFWNKSRQT